MALPKKYRFSWREKKIFGQIFEGPFFKLVFRENPGKHFAFVVSSRIVKRAVARNKIKRRLFEAIRERLEGLKDGDYIFYAKKVIANKDFKTIKEELKRFLADRNFLKDEKPSFVTNTKL